MYYTVQGICRVTGAHAMAKGESRDAANGKLEVELRRGVLVLSVLSQLRTAQYGYSLRQALAGAGMPIEEGTLYPLLRRLESLGLLVSEWRIEDGPPRRYYTLSPDGARHFQNLSASWSELVSTVNGLIAKRK
jgi:PadR family transcriptional regulator, regulatory protein PadR